MSSVKNARISNPDVISDLPSNLTEHILICLPLRDAVRTSILSSKWRYKWLTMPRLVFNNQLCSKLKLPTAVYQVLQRHKGPILDFVLYMKDVERSDVSSWILSLSNNHIQNFSLHSRWLELPSHFYSFSQLRHLYLRFCTFKPPATFKGFTRLASLKLAVVLVPDTFSTFISSCPLLQILELRNCFGFKSLKIDAPNLNNFSFIGTTKALCFRNTPLLAKVFILFSEDEEHSGGGEAFNLMEIFGGLLVIEQLTLGSYVCKSIAAGDARPLPSITFKHLKRLQLLDVCFKKVDVVTYVLWLIRSSPNLQQLFIIVPGSVEKDDVVGPVVNLFRTPDCSNCSFNQLRKVTMRIYCGTEPELEFAKFLLANSMALETMHIWAYKADEPHGLKMLKELVQLPRASPKAKIVYGGDKEPCISDMPW